MLRAILKHRLPIYNLTFKRSSSILNDKCNEILKERACEYEVVQKELNDSSESLSRADFARLAQKEASLARIAERYYAILDLKEELEELEELESDSDGEMAKMAVSEIPGVTERLKLLETEALDDILPPEEENSCNSILEIRAGTGGDEASLFARDLFEMYENFARKKGWKYEMLNCSTTVVGGYKEVVAAVAGDNVFGTLRNECGGHRVQRIPTTESKGRVQTSTATVCVLPEPTEVDASKLVKESDLRIDTFKAQGCGGQSVNTTDSAVRITHIPSGIVVANQDERSQHKNKEKALKVLKSKLYEEKCRAAQQERDKERADMVGSGDRNERIRTYNFPQDRISDHRYNITVNGIEHIMNGSNLGDLMTTIRRRKRDELLKRNVGLINRDV